jgi:hypothetical protein
LSLIAAIAAAETARSDRMGVMIEVSCNQLKGSGFRETTIVLPGKSLEEISF